MKTFFACLLLSLSLAGCQTTINCVEGNHTIVKATRNSKAFSKVAVQGNLQVILKRGATPAISLEADSNLLPLVQTVFSGDVLTLSTKGCVTSAKPITVYLTAPVFLSLSVEGSGSISSPELLTTDEEQEMELSVKGSGEMDLEIYTKKLAATIEGSGALRVKGAADEQQVKLKGSGDYYAFGLKTLAASVSTEGSGKAEVTAAQELNAVIEGSGTITYQGSPNKITQKTEGSGKLVHKE